MVISGGDLFWFDGSFDLLLKCKVLFCCRNNRVLNTVICASIVLANAVCVSAKIGRTLSSHTILLPKSVVAIFVFNYTVSLFFLCSLTKGLRSFHLYLAVHFWQCLATTTIFRATEITFWYKPTLQVLIVRT